MSDLGLHMVVLKSHNPLINFIQFSLIHRVLHSLSVFLKHFKSMLQKLEEFHSMPKYINCMITKTLSVCVCEWVCGYMLCLCVYPSVCVWVWVWGMLLSCVPLEFFFTSHDSLDKAIYCKIFATCKSFTHLQCQKCKFSYFKGWRRRGKNEEDGNGILIA